ncbi:SWIM zinc finger family protein [Cellulomonas shaoxiangyii]|uniref:SWIM zinc finger family protein n=1 Tax=Cellulomonas shaoxiangyii TaxID=2566013 RepID=A0A4P7SHQ4_9CELL|nr:SWIM zinc finger family protein [Cellulomonas shaoxiangyii]QCB93057.1 SWIM zinc finger family protein [Cellulomonas shaoxiangyii]TGY84674.1 SWIM zinc finger family protein [Cellulomonas shaoxiangyii]
MERWTVEDVQAAAPDASSLAAARRLAQPGPWSQTGASDALLWGRCQGSGRTPYQVSVDLQARAYRCSCPSRKFPCKHALALLLLWSSGAVGDGADAAPFAQEWADERASRAAGRAERAARPEAPVDPEAAERRRAQRVATMSAGLDDLALWLADLVRAGLAAARRQPLSWWDATAARLVDAQVPGLAEEVRSVGGRVQHDDDWASVLLAALGRWWTVVQAWRRRDELDEAVLGDLRTLLGWAQPADEVRARDRLSDTWLVLGAFRTQDGRVQQQRTWLRGEASGEVVQVLDFAVGGDPLPVAQSVGALLRGDVARYPGASARRATFVTPPEVAGTAGRLPAGGDVAAAHATLARALAANPWTRRVPVVLAGARLDVVRTAADHGAVVVPGAGPGAGGAGHGAGGADVVVVDRDGRGVPVRGDVEPWGLVARSGGAPVDLFGELEDGTFRVLAASGLADAPGVVGA